MTIAHGTEANPTPISRPWMRAMIAAGGEERPDGTVMWYGYVYVEVQWVDTKTGKQMGGRKSA